MIKSLFREEKSKWLAWLLVAALVLSVFNAPMGIFAAEDGSEVKYYNVTFIPNGAKIAHWENGEYIGNFASESVCRYQEGWSIAVPNFEDAPGPFVGLRIASGKHSGTLLTTRSEFDGFLIEEDITVEYVWDTEGVVAVTLDPNGGTFPSGMSVGSDGMYRVNVKATDGYYLSSAEKEGYTLVGWEQTTGDDEGSVYSVYSYVYPTEDTAYKAVWEKEKEKFPVQITLKANGGTFNHQEGPGDINYNDDDYVINTYTGKDIALWSYHFDPVKEGYVFVGWQVISGTDVDRVISGWDEYYPTEDSVLSAYWTVYVDERPYKECDLADHIGDAIPLTDWYADIEGASTITATYPCYSIDPDTWEESMEMRTGEGYFFEFDIPENAVAEVTVVADGEFGTESSMLLYNIYKTDDGYYYDYFKEDITGYLDRYMETFYEEDVRTFALYGDSKGYVFIPVGTPIINFRYSFYGISSYQNGCAIVGEPADYISSFTDSAYEVTAGEAFNLEDADTITASVVTKIASSQGTIPTWHTEQITGKLLKINFPDAELRWTLDYFSSTFGKYGIFDAESIDGRIFQAEQEYYEGNPRIYLNDGSWAEPGNTIYLFLPEAISLQEQPWSQIITPDNLSPALDENKVNVVGWDSTLKMVLDKIKDKYPNLYNKVNYIDLGYYVGPEYMNMLQDIANGKYNGYTIMAAAEVSQLSAIKDYPALSTLGFTDADYEQSYLYLKDLGTFGGKLKAVTWQGCPNGFFYNVNIAKKVLGTDDPEAVQEMISTPAKFNAVASKMKKAGYFMTAGLYDRVATPEAYASDTSSRATAFNELFKDYDVLTYDAGGGEWTTVWSDGMGNGKVFGYFGTTWLQGTMSYYINNQSYGLCEGPVSYYSGGSFVAVKGSGTLGNDAANILKALVSDESVMTSIAMAGAGGTFVNNKAVNKDLIDEETFKGATLNSTQDFTPIWHRSALILGGESTEEIQLSVGWNEIDGKKYYCFKDGTKAVGIQRINKQYYFFDRHGVMLTGWQTVDGNTYYMNEEGILQRYMVEIYGKKYYFNGNGVMQTGWLTLNGAKYYLNADGSVQTGWKKLDKVFYRFDAEGVMQTGWLTLKGKTYYLGTDGAMRTGICMAEDKLYYFGTDGALQKTAGWLELDGKKYYLNDDGTAKTGWAEIDSKRYYFGDDGVLQSGGWIEVDGKKYYLNDDGTPAVGWKKINRKYYRFNDTGAMLTGWFTQKGKTYYFDADGVMQTGWVREDGKSWYMDADGVMQRGWLEADGNTYYLGEDGTVQYGWKKIGGYYYRFDELGVMVRGWFVLKNSTYYLNTDGTLATGWKKINKRWYRFSDKGVMLTGWTTKSGNWYYLDETGAMVVNTTLVIDGVKYKFDKNGVCTNKN